MTIVVQVNGKLRDNIEVPVEISQDDLKAAARTEKVEKHLEGKTVKKVIVVPEETGKFCGRVGVGEIRKSRAVRSRWVLCCRIDFRWSSPTAPRRVRAGLAVRSG